MKKLFLIFFISGLFSSGASAQETIECANGQCSPSFSPQLLLEKPFYTAIDVGNNNQDINVSVPQNQNPRSLRIHMTNGENLKDLTVNLSSNKEGANAADTYIIGDLFRNLTVRLNGFNGTKGKDASEICASNILAGEYGSDIKNFFEQRRAADPGVPANKCDRVDLNYMQTFGFTCDDPSYTYTPGTTPVIDVERLRTKARCSGVLVRDLCLRRKKTGYCQWRTWVVTGCGKHGCSYGWGGSFHTRSRTWIELQYNYERNRRSSDNFCSVYYGWPGGSWRLWSEWSSFTSPQVNSATYEPLPGSIWEIYRTTAYGACASYWSSVRTEVISKITYDENNTACDDVGVAEDPNNLIDWTYTGPAQEPEFGTEIIQCAVGACPVNNTVSEFNRELEVIQPESGTDGSQQGAGLVFIYDTENLTAESSIGQAGAAGRSDLQGAENIQYCYKKSDASTHGNASDFARNPSISFRKYRWQAIRTTGAGDTGNPPPSTGKKVEIYKKLDSSVRHLLKEELF